MDNVGLLAVNNDFDAIIKNIVRAWADPSYFNNKVPYTKENYLAPEVPMTRVVPLIKRAIFKLDLFDKVYDEKTKKNKRVAKKNPVLVTKVEFTDGTYTVVKNCKNDKVEVVDAKDPVTGKFLGVKVATATSKEAAVAYAMLKRIYGKPNPENKFEYVTAGAGTTLANIIENAWDQDYEEAITDIKKERIRQENIAKHQKIQEEAHARKVKKIAKQLRLKSEAEAYNVKFQTSKKTTKSK